MATPRVLILRAPAPTATARPSSPSSGPAPWPSASTSIGCANSRASLHHYQILVIPGGFTYGDDVAAGKILANQLAAFPRRRPAAIPRPGEADPRHLQRLSGAAQGRPDRAARPRTARWPRWPTTTAADSRTAGSTCSATPGNCPFLKGYRSAARAGGARRRASFVCREPWMLKGLKQAGQVVLRYVDDERPAGAVSDQPERLAGRRGRPVRSSAAGSWA